MSEVFLEWGGDFVASATGGLLLADGPAGVRQRIERRLFTAVHGYVFHKKYGAGLPRKIGSVLSVTQIQSIVKSQLALEASVATSPPATVSVSAAPNDPSQIIISISYIDAQTNEPVLLQIKA
jgi:hypothetical protein